MKSRGLLVLIVVGLFLSLSSINVAASTWIQTTQEDFESGTLENLDTTSSPGDVKLKLLGDSDWTVNYTADELPEDSDPAWTKYQVEDASVEEGILTVCAGSYPFKYYREDVFGDNAVGNVVELRMKRSAGEGSVSIMMADGERYLQIFIWPTNINVKGEPIFVNTTEYHTYRITLKGSVYKFYVDGTERASGEASGKGPPPNKVMFEGHNTCSYWNYVKYYTGGAIPPGGYLSPGTLTSSAYDAGVPADWGTINWTADTSAQGTSVKFRTRTAATQEGLDSASWSSYYTESGSSITSPSNRWIQYEATLETTGSQNTPILSDVTISYTTNILLYAPWFFTGTWQGDYESELWLVNTTTQTINGTVTALSGSGATESFDFTIGPERSQALEPLSELLPTIQTGALRLTYTGNPGDILARILIGRDGLLQDGYQLEDPAKHQSPTLYAPWFFTGTWQGDYGSELWLVNTSDQTINGTVTALSGSGTSESFDFSIQAGYSQVLEPLSELLPTIQTGALKLTHTGNPGDILARILIGRDGSIQDGNELENH